MLIQLPNSRGTCSVFRCTSADKFPASYRIPASAGARSYGIKYRSLQEAFIDTTHSFGDLLAAFVAKVAELERQRIRERVKAGLEKARSQGTRLGRPKLVFDRS